MFVTLGWGRGGELVGLPPPQGSREPCHSSRGLNLAVKAPCGVDLTRDPSPSNLRCKTVCALRYWCHYNCNGTLSLPLGFRWAAEVLPLREEILPLSHRS